MISLIAYVDCANLLSVSTFGFETFVKYAYFIFITLAYIMICFKTTQLNIGFDGPTIFLVFTATSVAALGFQMVSPVQNNSYAGAFLATLLVSAAAMFDIKKHVFDSWRVERIIQKLLLLLSLFYVLELAVRVFSGLSYFEDVTNQTNHIKSFVFVTSACLAILLRDYKSLLLTAILLIISQILRPSSSLIAAMFLGAPIAVALLRGWIKVAKGCAYATIIGAAAAPIALYLSPELKEFIIDAETWTKEDLLQGRSNTFFRLAIQDLAIDQLQDTSILFGAVFSSANSVALGRKFLWWMQYYPTGLAAIHSDYVSILYQSGVVGYVLYNLALWLICRFLFSGVVMARAQGQSSALISLSICCVIIVVFYSSSNPFLQYYTIAHVAWLLIAIGYIHVRFLKRSKV